MPTTLRKCPEVAIETTRDCKVNNLIFVCGYFVCNVAKICVAIVGSRVFDGLSRRFITVDSKIGSGVGILAYDPGVAMARFGSKGGEMRRFAKVAMGSHITKVP